MMWREALSAGCITCGRPMVARRDFFECPELCTVFKEGRVWGHFHYWRLRSRSMAEVLKGGGGDGLAGSGA